MSPKKAAKKKVAKKKVAAAPKSDADGARLFLRHTVATLAYRCGKAVRGAPESLLSQANGKERWPSPSSLSWDGEVERFYASLQAYDAYLALKKPLHKPAESMFQGAIADALTHTGQLTMLRRLAGSHVRGENYSRADIQIGRVGPAQSPPPERSEFD